MTTSTTLAPTAAGPSVPATSTRHAPPRRLAWIREQGMGASILVAAISSAFGVVLLSTFAFFAFVLGIDPWLAGSSTAALSFVFVGLALYVGAIVTANTFMTVVVGRTRRIALMRLIGATARSQRALVTRQGLGVGLIGAVLGLAAGLGLSIAGVAIVVAALGLDLEMSEAISAVLQPTAALPALAVTLTTWAAARAGSRRVLTVSPLQALGAAVEHSHDAVAARTGRNITAIVLIVIGVAFLGLGVVVGSASSSPGGLALAFLGGILSFTGLILGSTVVMPPVLRLVGRAFGRSATARLAAENALRYPERSSRMAIGVVMGVTLVTMFSVAIESMKAVMVASTGGRPVAEMSWLLDTFAAVTTGLIAVSAVIAAVGLVNLLNLGVVQRRRELGLLRSLGVSSTQVRRMVLLEAAHITIAAVGTGLVLGVLYGWVGVQSVFGSTGTPPLWTSPTFVPPVVPWGTVAVIVVATAVLTIVAAVVPTRLATRVTPVEALVVD